MRTFLFMLLIVGFVALTGTGCDREMTNYMMDTVSPTVPTVTPSVGDTEAFRTALLVEAAIELHKTEGIEAVIDYYNDPISIDGQWYVFIADENDRFIAHPAAPSLIGRNIKDIESIDGSPVGAHIAMATISGHWTEYLWPNPETNKLEKKLTWSKRHDGYLFGSGYYRPWHPDPATLPTVSKDDPEAFTRAGVLKAIARYETEGVEATAAYYNDPANIDGLSSVFIADENDHLVAYQLRPDLVGTELNEVMGALGAEIAKTTEIGLMNAYLLPNQAIGEYQQINIWSIRHDGYLFGVVYSAPVSEGPDLVIDGIIIPPSN